MTSPAAAAPLTLTGKQRAKFLAIVKADPKTGNAAALRQAGVSGTRGQLRALIENEPGLAEEARDARGFGNGTIRAEMARRAIQGVDEPVFHNGQVVGHVTKYSDRLLAKMADAYLPEYRNAKQRLEVTGAGGGPIELEGRAVVGLADVVRLARELGLGDQVGVDAGHPPGELPAAPPVRPDPAAG